jgi:hypothetical protein
MLLSGCTEWVLWVWYCSQIVNRFFDPDIDLRLWMSSLSLILVWGCTEWLHPALRFCYIELNFHLSLSLQLWGCLCSCFLALRTFLMRSLNFWFWYAIGVKIVWNIYAKLLHICVWNTYRGVWKGYGTKECNIVTNMTSQFCRPQLKCDGTRWRAGGEVKGKLANAVGSQESSHYLGTRCIQRYYHCCAHFGCQQSTELTPPPPPPI